ncbi:MAG: DNA primase [Bdellovibrionales bacterium]|nr:DNA primase [Bdellovibrionales bacterium]
MFSDNTLEEIRARMNIVDLVGEYLPLKKSGTGFSGLCPFHKEKTPSFHVHPVKQVFHCFGCHKGGNVFTFLRLIEGISFPDAVRKLADKTGVRIEEESPRRQAGHQKGPTEPSRAQKALEWAAKYFHYLLTEVQVGSSTRAYLKGRGLSEHSINKFKLGLAPSGWHTLSELMQKRGFSMTELEQAGLAIPKSKGSGYYDRFRERLMFPIRDPKGQVIGFGARILTGEKDQPKYLNSPESSLFNKRLQLYGLYENQREIRLRGEAILVEGYMDVVGLFEKGVTNAIATMGTALTEEHCRSLRAQTKKVVTVFDPDAAGKDAWHRSVDIFMRAGMFAKDLELPDGLDPDEFVQKYSAEEFYKRCEAAPRQVTKLLREIATQGTLSEEQRGHWLERLTPVLVASRRLPDRALIWDSLALVLNVSVEMLKELSQGGPATRAAAANPPASQRPRRPAEPAKPQHNLDALDLQFFCAAVAAPELFLKSEAAEWLEGIRGETLRGYLAELHQTADPAALQSKLLGIQTRDSSTEFQEEVAQALLLETKDSASVFGTLLRRVQDRKREFQIRAISKQVRLSQRLGENDQAQLQLLEKLKNLRGGP